LTSLTACICLWRILFGLNGRRWCCEPVTLIVRGLDLYLFLNATVFFYLVKNNLWPKRDQTSLFEYAFTKLFGERLGRKDREHSKEVSLCNLGCAVEYLFSKALLEFELELLKRADVERLR
jgi:hypothetical protein